MSKKQKDIHTKMELKKIEWKQSLLKSLIYRALALALGTLTVFLITGSIAIATGAAILTELVQGVNYFIYEIIWSNISRRKLEKKIIERFKRREINLKLDFSSIKELAYQLSQIDTFVPKLYIQTKGIFDSMLENEELEEIHEDIKKFKEYFETVHSERKLFFPKVNE